jgi:hypothetical protein
MNGVFKASKDKVYYFPIPSDICMDLSRRLPHYFSDYYDSKIFFEYFNSNIN